MKIALGEIATYINGYAFKPEDRGKHGLPIIRIQDLTGNSYDLAYYDGKYPEKIEINNGDILISWSASLGVYKWNRGKALLNQHIFKVVFDKKPIDKQYFVFATEYHLREMEQQTHGATMKHITKSAFEKIEIPYPKLEKQKKIANKLERTKSLLLKQHRKIELLDQLLKARFVEMFGDPIDNSKGWMKKKLQEIVTPDCSISYGIVQPGANQAEGVPIFRPVDIVNPSPKRSELKKTTKEISDGYKRTILKGKELLITVRANIGDTIIVGKEFTGCNVGRGIVPLRTDERKITLEFLKAQLDNDHYQNHIKGLAKGITLIQLNMVDLRNLQIIVPPLDLQNHYVDFVYQVDKSKNKFQSFQLFLP